MKGSCFLIKLLILRIFDEISGLKRDVFPILNFPRPIRSRIPLLTSSYIRQLTVAFGIFGLDLL
jgi:hypothetical protein